MWIYLNNTDNRIEAISMNRNDPKWVDDGFEEVKIPNNFNIYVEYTNDAGETRKREMTATELRTAMSYSENRYNEYPDIGEQLDKLYHDIQDGTLTTSGSFATAITAVKTANPKPTPD